MSFSRRSGIALAAIIGIVWGAPAAPAAARTAVPVVDAANTILVKFRAGVSAAERRAALRAAGGRAVNRLSLVDVDVVALAVARASALARLERDARVEYAVPNRTLSLFTHRPATNDPDLRLQRHLDRERGYRWLDGIGIDHDIDAPEGWRLAYGPNAEGRIRFPSAATGPEIGIIDSGVDPAHPDIGPKLVACASATMVVGTVHESPETCRGRLAHGTHVAGIAAAVTDNGQGVAGVAPDSPISSCNVFQTFGKDSTGTLADLVGCIDWLVRRRVAVINMSLGMYGGADPVLFEAVERAWADGKGTLLVAAAGNGGGDEETNIPAYPAAYPQVVSVAALDHRDCRAEFSNYDQFVELAAPGTHIYSTWVDYDWNNAATYNDKSGTSMAAPQVAAAAALLKRYHPELTAGELRLALRHAAEDIEDPGRDDLTGYGRINLARTLSGTPGPRRGVGTIVGSARYALLDKVTTLPRTCRRASTDDITGEYRLENMPEGTYYVSLYNGNASCNGGVVTVTAGQTTRHDLC